MGDKSKIAWTDATWNPWIGCHNVSEECRRCYARTDVNRKFGPRGYDFDKPWRAKTTLRKPLKWNREAVEFEKLNGRRFRAFTSSWTDFFLAEADEWRNEAWDVIRECHYMDFLILTKRPSRVLDCLPADWGQGWSHVWLGTTCGVRHSYPRLDALRKIPATVRFISAEPLLESMADIDLTGFHWLIAGGESGSGFRKMEDAWAVELKDKCAAEGVGFFFKQHSSFRPGQGEILEGREYHEAPLVQIVDTGLATSGYHHHEVECDQPDPKL
jgi:protein gp37